MIVCNDIIDNLDLIEIFDYFFILIIYGNFKNDICIVIIGVNV